jgi:opacity protein-like surface antigen
MAWGCGRFASADSEGWYAGAEGGLNISPRLSFASSQSGWTETHDVGAGAILQGGYDVDHLQFEGEVSWRSNDVSQLSRPAVIVGNNYRFPTVTGLNGNGQGALDVGAVMANVYYRVPTGMKATPFIGVGVGDARISQDRVGVGGVIVGNQSGFAFAYQGIAGISYALDRRFAIKAEYRNFRTSDAQFGHDQLSGGPDSRGSYWAQSAFFGFTYNFQDSDSE